MNYRNRGFDPEQFFGPDGPFGPRGPLGPGGIFGPQGPMGTGGSWPQFFGGGDDAGSPWGGRGRGPRRGPGPRRAPRGAIRHAILELLLRRGEPMNGYDLMQGIADATRGDWTPSSGAIYPALAQLDDERLIAQVEIDGRKAYELTEQGRAAAEAGPRPLAGYVGEEPEDPWRASRGRAGRRHPEAEGGDRRGRHGGRGTGGQLWKAVGGVAMATQAVGQSGDEALAREAGDLLDRTRRELYRMLAESEVAKDDEQGSRYGEHGEPYDGDEDEITDGEIVED